MKLRDLQAFRVVAEERSISAAAPLVSLSQPGLSRLLQRLESEIGATLFDRGCAELQLTPAGVALYARVDSLIDALEDTATDARMASRRQQPTLTVGVLFPGAAELTRPILEAYRRASPGVPLKVVDVSRLGAERAVEAGEVDAAFLWSPVASRTLQTVPLYLDQLTLIVARRHPLAGRNVVDVEEVAEEAYTVTSSMSDAWRRASTLPPWRERLGHSKSVRNVRDAMQAVVAGEAVTIGPLSLSRFPPRPAVRFVPLKWPRRPASVVSIRREDTRPHVRRFVDVASTVASHCWQLVPAAQPGAPASHKQVGPAPAKAPSFPMTDLAAAVALLE